VLFGGWASRWLGDAHVLNVQQVVGPPYAIMGVKPDMVPNTGNVHVNLDVRGIKKDATVLLRLIAGDRFVDCTGSAIEDNVVDAQLPSLESLRARRCDIHISTPGGIPSITSVPMRIFNVSHASNCLAFGPGVLQESLQAGAPTEFIIQAMDESGALRDTGADVFTVQIQSEAEIEAAEQRAVERERAAKAAAKAPARKKKQAQETEDTEQDVDDSAPCLPVEIEDLGTGQYLVRYTPPEAGAYRMAVEFTGTHGGQAGPIRGSVFTVQVADGTGAAASNNAWAGSAYMESIKDDIKMLNNFARQTLDGLQREVPADSLEVLLAVKTHLSHVGEHADREKLRIDCITACLAHLQAETLVKQRDAEKLVKALEVGSTTWAQAQRQAPLTKTSIAPHIKHHSNSTKREVELFQHAMREFDSNVRGLPAWQYETGAETAHKAVEDMLGMYSLQQKRVDRIQHLATTFEFPHLMQPAHEIMAALKEDMTYVQQLWDDERRGLEYFAESREQLWSEVKPDDLEEGAKGLHKVMKKHGNKRVRNTELYKGLDKTIKDFLSTCPLISALGHRSMRPRHWELLMKATGKTFKPPHEDPNMKLTNLLELGLHDYTDAVDEICDQALKEEKMEDTLARLKEAWASIVFETEAFDEGYSDVLLVKMSEEDFEMLENDQMAVQSMVTSRFVQTFYDDIMHWRDSLSNVSEVMLLLAEIQRTWSYLEPLFIRSEEVRKELPEDAERFAQVDKEVKEMLAHAVSTSNVKAACNREGLIARLESGKALLDQCQKALDDFLAAKRVIFPRFYFVSNADLLDILSNGSNL
jgi:dynein heavy chain